MSGEGEIQFWTARFDLVGDMEACAQFIDEVTEGNWLVKIDGADLGPAAGLLQAGTDPHPEPRFERVDPHGTGRFGWCAYHQMGDYCTIVPKTPLFRETDDAGRADPLHDAAQAEQIATAAQNLVDAFDGTRLLATTRMRRIAASVAALRAVLPSRDGERIESSSESPQTP